MPNQSYLDWVIRNTRTEWWHDSAQATELALGLERGAIGVTTNPYLANLALVKDRQLLAPAIEAVLARNLPPEQKAEALMRIAVTTTAGLDVMEDCIAKGITIAMTISFTVPQAIAIAERHMAGMRRARAIGVEPGKCFAVVKRAYRIYRERGYQAVLLIAALRGDYHLTELAGAGLLMSIAPAIQRSLVTHHLPREERIDQPVPAGAIERLRQMPEFVRAYEPDGMAPSQFVAFGATQRTLSQFVEAGWKLMENYR
jgi:transaldolase